MFTLDSDDCYQTISFCDVGRVYRSVNQKTLSTTGLIKHLVGTNRPNVLRNQLLDAILSNVPPISRRLPSGEWFGEEERPESTHLLSWTVAL
jgi:hypothetical protein